MNLKVLVRESFAAVLRFSGLAALMRLLGARGKATIVMYHDPRPEVLARHLDYYAARYNFVTLEQVVGALRDGAWDRLPSRPLVITIDDGHRGNLALTRVCRRHGVTPTVYLCSQLVDTGRHFWWLHGDLARDPGQAVRLKDLPADRRLEALEKNFGYSPQREYPSRQALNRPELGEMAPDFDFQSHGRFHLILTELDDRTCREEISTSRGEVEALTGRPCSHFAYPNGDYSEREKRYLAEAGYLSARSTDFGWVGPGSDPYALKIQGMPDDASLNWLDAYLSGIPGWVRYARQGRFNGRKPPAKHPFQTVGKA